MADYDDELLTEEERTALEGDEGADTGADDDAADSGWNANAANADDGDVADGEASDSEDDGEQAGADDAGAEEGDDAASSDEEAATAGEDDPPAPQQQEAPAPAADVDMQQVQSVLDGYEEKRKELLDKFDDGDVTREEFQTQLDALENERTDAQVEKRMYERQMQEEDRRWQSAVGDYLNKYPDLRDNQELLQRYDQHVRSVTEDPDFAHLSFEQQLAHAHAQFAVKAQALGIEGVPDIRVAPKQQQPAKTKKQPAKKAEPEAPANEGLGEAPTTLARAPASEITGGSDDKFAVLKQMEKTAAPDEYEAAVAKLSPEERDEYSSMA